MWYIFDVFFIIYLFYLSIFVVAISSILGLRVLHLTFSGLTFHVYVYEQQFNESMSW